MFRFMLQKLKQKKWMIGCILIGNVLLMTVLSSQVMYKTAAIQRMMEGEFANYEEENYKWPFEVSFAKRFVNATPEILQEMDNYIHSFGEKWEVPYKEEMKIYALIPAAEKSAIERDDSKNRNSTVRAMTGIDDNIEIINGRMYQTTMQSGCAEVIVSEKVYVTNGYLMNEELLFDKYVLSDGQPLCVKIVGVYKALDNHDSYWATDPEEYHSELYMAPELFTELFCHETLDDIPIDVEYHSRLDYTKVNCIHLMDIKESAQKELESFKDRKEKDVLSPLQFVGLDEVADSYHTKYQRINATLTILIIPVCVLLCAFLYMISGQMLSMEQNEIAVMKSRGASRKQILLLYFYQSTFLALIGMIVGLPLGRLLCTVLGSSTAFLEFGHYRPLHVILTWQLFWTCVAEFVINIFFTLIPVVQYSGVGIVHAKQRKSSKIRKWWEKMYVDVILLAISIFGFYSFNKRMGDLTEYIMTGEGMNPLLYVCSSVFILGAGLLFLRIQPYLVKLIYMIGKKKWKPAYYVSFLQIIRTGKSQQFIMIFLVLTMALGIFNATVARTIIANAEDNKTYLDGADIVIQEKWKDNRPSYKHDPEKYPLTYYEPDYTKYTNADWIEASTKVLVDEEAKVKLTKDSTKDIILMGIHTKEFGELSLFDSSLNPEPYYELLNRMAVDPRGMIVSNNFKNDLGFKIGDTLHYYDRDKTEGYGTIVGFVDYWPGYEANVYGLDEDGNMKAMPNYLVVANIRQVQNDTRLAPYQVWAKTNGNSDDFFRWTEENDVKILSYHDLQEDLTAIRTETLFQGTSGILTMSFIVILILCGIGFLIFWIMSIRSREMMFGVLRAMGLKEKEVFVMLLSEQVFSSFYSIVAGGVVGYFASKMFVPMIQTAYAGTDQVLPLQMVMQMSDWIRLLAVVLGMLVICLLVLLRMVEKSNISGALKLGEE